MHYVHIMKKPVFQLVDLTIFNLYQKRRDDMRPPFRCFVICDPPLSTGADGPAVDSPSAACSEEFDLQTCACVPIVSQTVSVFVFGVCSDVVCIANQRGGHADMPNFLGDDTAHI